jgi:putative spermidine/putrescine transport system substrate-binding protein/spermidine/putrescine transport system substrate-binding protein
MVAAVAGAPAVQAAEVNLLTWEGYADESFIKPFEEATGCEVSATYVGSNDDFAPKLAAGGGVYDLVSPSIDATKALIEAGFIDSVDLSRLPRYGEIYEKFRTAEGVNHDGEVYGVPFSWGSIPFMYRTDKFDSPPTSLNILWDPALEGNGGQDLALGRQERALRRLSGDRQQGHL